MYHQLKCLVGLAEGNHRHGCWGCSSLRRSGNDIQRGLMGECVNKCAWGCEVVEVESIIYSMC